MLHTRAIGTLDNPKEYDVDIGRAAEFLAAQECEFIMTVKPCSQLLRPKTQFSQRQTLLHIDPFYRCIGGQVVRQDTKFAEINAHGMHMQF